MFAQLLYSKPSVFVNDRFLCVRHDAPFLLRLAYQLVHFIADGGRFQINHTAGVFPIAQDGINGAVLP